MTDHKHVGQLKIMLGHAQRALEMDAPDMKIVEKLLNDALNLAIEINEPPNPYADPALRPGLRRSSEHDVTNYEGKHDG